MHGNASLKENLDTYNPIFNPILKKYQNRYHFDKVKQELQQKWNVKYYARYTRGFYVSLTMDYEKLVLEAEKRRKSYLDKQLKIKQRAALEKARQQLYEQHL